MEQPTTISARKCATCRFVHSERMQGQIMPMLVCRGAPPSVSMVTTPQGIQGMTLFPVVKPTDFCHCWTPKEVSPETDSAPLAVSPA